MEMSRKITVLVVALCAALAMIVSPSQAAEFVKGVLQPLPDGFPNRPLVIMVIDEPGSSDSIFATHLAEAAGKISPVKILIEHREDFSNFGLWEGLAWIKDQGKLGTDGYISAIYGVPGNVIDLLVIDMKTEAGVDQNDLYCIVNAENTRYYLHQRANAPWGNTIQDFLAYAKKNPGTMRYISGGAGGGQDAAMQWYMRGLGFTVKEIIGGGADARARAVAAGEGDVTVSRPESILPHFQAGKLNVLMVGGSDPAPTPWEGVPTAASLGLKDDPYGTFRSIGTLKEATASHRAWLSTLYTAAAKDPQFIERRKKIPGLTYKIHDSQEMETMSKNAYDFTLPIMKDLGVYWADKKK
jgi:tripartite-type tricarboxylate transporter receptor subunit TctC